MSTPGTAPIVFVHIPRAAGTTFTEVLRDNFPGGVRALGSVFRPVGGLDPRATRRLGEVSVRTRGASALTGRVPYAVRNRLPGDTRCVTFLRDPVERTLSHYYELVRLNRRRPLPGDGSLAATLAAGDLIYDNLQTRMLSDADEPLGDVDDAMLAQAKENLRSGLTAYGIVERFDESLVLLGQSLGLESLLYVRKRFATRPRGVEVPEDMLRAAERSNRYDLELYRSALDLFGQRVAEQGSEFHVTLAALRAARDGEIAERPPDATPDELWHLLVGARADALRDRFDRASAGSTEVEQARAILEQVRELVGEPSGRLAGPAENTDTERRRPPESRRARTTTRAAEIEQARTAARRALEQLRDDGGSAEAIAIAERRLQAIEERALRARAKSAR